MALYLGNQKVSLRSGQDPTFDYGFDSNGRLVFANKNATEINNFLNYDSSYSETLDLSNLNKMEKVAVNGTANRKMEGLKGLLVSQNAPFTGSSPQINASYTGLNKSALVSLFESAPYNVGYTKVGNPTIVDGVVSGFSSSDYLTIQKQIPNLENAELQITITPKATTGEVFLFLNKVFSVQLNNGSIQSYDFKNQHGIIVVPASDLTLGSSYKIKIQCYADLEDSSTLKISYCYSKNGSAFTSPVINETLKEQTGNIYIGNWQKLSRPFTGSIDLNETYIKVNGVPWFTGKPAMTKTCSIVGATGTADLTQEDKNIILNKGWSLTVQ